jgi:Leucine-rich repeat (LRR) protein
LGNDGAEPTNVAVVFSAPGVFSIPNAGLSKVPEELATVSKNLRTLSLPQNKLELFPDFFFTFAQLRNLDLTDNHFTSVPPQLVKLELLETLRLAGNRLTAFASADPEVPTLRFPKLKTLDLSRNRLTSCPHLDSEVLPKLQVANLASNKISDIPAGFVAKCTAEEIDFASNDLVTLPEELADCPNLVVLTISRNQISQAGFPPRLLKSPRLSVLNIEECPLTLRHLMDMDGYENVRTVLQHALRFHISTRMIVILHLSLVYPAVFLSPKGPRR